MNNPPPSPSPSSTSAAKPQQWRMLKMRSLRDSGRRERLRNLVTEALISMIFLTFLLMSSSSSSMPFLAEGLRLAFTISLWYMLLIACARIVALRSLNIHVSLGETKREAPPGEKPEPVKTHLGNMIIVPAIIGSIIEIYNGKIFIQIEVKPEMIGHYLAEFSISYKPVKQGRPGIGAIHSRRFILLK
ncbi:ribosomal protein S15 [Datura stramonium]|uniref:Ribosomal protein S15 n=1 Tax=Datura stramonium TaxID=4076 RepID=A0ABS8UM14_DATST|nr:ribosomal protein S15 [Datura stramonium]